MWEKKYIIFNITFFSDIMLFVEQYKMKNKKNLNVYTHNKYILTFADRLLITSKHQQKCIFSTALHIKKPWLTL